MYYVESYIRFPFLQVKAVECHQFPMTEVKGEKNTINEMLSLVDGFKSSLDTGEEKISDLCGRPIGNTHPRPGEK